MAIMVLDLYRGLLVKTVGIKCSINAFEGNHYFFLFILQQNPIFGENFDFTPVFLLVLFIGLIGICYCTDIINDGELFIGVVEYERTSER